jgi:hypothetical protein
MIQRKNPRSSGRQFSPIHTGLSKNIWPNPIAIFGQQVFRTIIITLTINESSCQEKPPLRTSYLHSYTYRCKERSHSDCVFTAYIIEQVNDGDFPNNATSGGSSSPSGLPSSRNKIAWRLRREHLAKLFLKCWEGCTSSGDTEIEAYSV